MANACTTCKRKNNCPLWSTAGRFTSSKLRREDGYPHNFYTVMESGRVKCGSES